MSVIGWAHIQNDPWCADLLYEFVFFIAHQYWDAQGGWKPSLWKKRTLGPIQYKDCLTSRGIPVIKMRQSWDCSLFNGNSHTSKMTSLYWDDPLIIMHSQYHGCWCPGNIIEQLIFSSNSAWKKIFVFHFRFHWILFWGVSSPVCQDWWNVNCWFHAKHVISC